MKNRIFAVAAATALVAAGILVPASTASASTSPLITIKLVHPSGALIGTSLDSSASIQLEADNADGEEDFDIYYAPSADPTDFPDSVRAGSVVNGQVAINVPAGDELYVNTQGGPLYLSTFNQYAIHSTDQNRSIKTIKGASISGTVLTPGATALAHAVVTAITSDGSPDASTTTDNSGHYTLGALNTGKYKLQFNSRSTDSGAAAANAAYSYNYYNNKKTWSGGSYVSVKQEGASNAASVKTGYNDTVVVGHTLTVNVHLGLTPGAYDDANIGIDNNSFGQGVFGNLNNTGTQFVTKLAKGTYVIYIFNDTHNYYWTGNTTKPTKSYSQAKKLDYKGTSNVTIQFG